MSLSNIPTYRLLGNSGLRVFPLCLGAMHFGYNETFSNAFGIGSTDDESEKIFLKYIQMGGNFIDTANIYSLGKSEVLIGDLIKKHNIDRESLVIATKYSGPTPNVNGPNAAGNNKKNLFKAVDDSLKRLQTHYIDLLYVHFWDFTLDVTQLVRWLDDLVKSGKVLHIAISDTPAWIVSRANTYAEQNALTPFTAYQGRYSLVDRGLDQDVIPMSKSLNIATVPWGIVGQGKLTGVRTRESDQDAKRKFVEISEQDVKVQQAVFEIAKELDRSPTQIAINWILGRTTSPILGSRTLEQFEDAVKSLEFQLSAEHLEKLNKASENSPALIFPHSFIGNSFDTNRWLFLGGPKTYNIEQ